MRVYYASTGEEDGILSLDDLIHNFTVGDAWGHVEPPNTAVDFRAQMISDGFVTGTHDCGTFIAVDVERVRAAWNLEDAK